ncbi:MAG: hypothetical protein ABI266_08815 [Ginsengibacter sp.]
MKKIIGALIVILSIAFIAIVILRIWGVVIVSLAFLLKGAVSLILIGGLLLFLVVIYAFFFSRPDKGYDQTKGNRAHPRL